MNPGRVPSGPAQELSAAGGRATHYLHPGQLYATERPCLVTTILGTCVAVGLWDVSNGIGGLNHYLLATDPAAAASARIGAWAIPKLVTDLVSLGATPSKLRAKVFGGTESAFGFTRAGKDLGRQNYELALQLLEERHIPVTASDVGGPRARKLLFRTDDGASWVKYL